jgi:hypothetical protein
LCFFKDLHEEVKPRQLEIDELNDLAGKITLDDSLREQTTHVNRRWTAVLVQINDVKVVFLFPVSFCTRSLIKAWDGAIITCCVRQLHSYSVMEKASKLLD